MATKKFENAVLKQKVVIDEKGTVGATKYAGMLMIAINTAPSGGFSPADNLAATKLYAKIDAVKEDEIIKLTPAELNQVKSAWANLRMQTRSQDVADIQEYLESL